MSICHSYTNAGGHCEKGVIVTARPGFQMLTLIFLSKRDHIRKVK